MQAAKALNTSARRYHRALADLKQAAEEQRQLIEQTFPSVYALDLKAFADAQRCAVERAMGEL